jgi:transcriptional regulator with XRE-family HTH domain
MYYREIFLYCQEKKRYFYLKGRNLSPNERIKLIREEKNLNQSEFGELFNYKQTKIKDIETGKQKVSIDFAEEIEKKFSINLRWILTGNGDKILKECNDIQYKNELIKMIEELDDKKSEIYYHLIKAEILKEKL